MVDLLGELDEPERVAQRGPHPVREVVGVDRDAVSAHPGPGVEGLEAERLGPGALDHVPQVDVQLVAELRHLVDQCDVDVPVGVLEQLGHLGLAGAAGRHHLVDDLRVEGGRPLQAAGSHPAHHLGRVPEPVAGVARIDPFRREGQEDVLADQLTVCFEQRSQQLFGGARPGGRLQHHQHAGRQVPADRVGGTEDRGQVGATVLGQRGRHADHHRARLRVQLGDHGRVRGGAEPGGEHLGDVRVRQVVDVGPAAAEGVDHLLVQVEADHAQAAAAGLLRQGQADIAQPHDHQVQAHAIHPPAPAHAAGSSVFCQGIVA